jgi:hypothetical protein
MAGAALAIPLLVIAAFFAGDVDPDVLPIGTSPVSGTVVVNFEGSPSPQGVRTARYEVEPGSNAWAAVQQALDRRNLDFQDFGAGLGILITGFYGVLAQGNGFWEFRVNGQSSDVGVSGYIVRDGDRLEFRYSNF